MRKTVLLGVVFLAVIVALVIYTSMGTRRYRCEVCMSYQGRTACRTVVAATREQAERSAIENACAQIASGVTDSSQCASTPPDRIRWLAP